MLTKTDGCYGSASRFTVPGNISFFTASVYMCVNQITISSKIENKIELEITVHI